MDIEKLLEEKSGIVEEYMKKIFPESDIPNLYDAVNYHLGTGGKRIRPVLAIATCEALGCDSKKILPFATACEILHQWLLIHDDIMDSDKVRRDKPTVWVKYGLAHGINVGDLMAQKVYDVILKSRDFLDDRTVIKLIKAMVNVSIKTSEGQAMDINLRNNNNPSEEDYMKTVIGKTAYYFSVPMIGGAIVAGADDKIIRALEEFGKRAGPAFQIADDLLDLTEGKGRGEIGRDIREGKRSILVVHCLSRCSKEERKRLLSILNKKVEETREEDILWVKGLFEKYGSIDYAKKKASALIEESKSVIKNLPESLGDVLSSFADYLIKRKK